MPPQAADQHGGSLDSLCTDLAATKHVIVASNRGAISFTQRDGALSVSANGLSGDMAALRGRLPLTWLSAAGSGPDRTAADQAAGELITRGLPSNWQARFVSPSRRAYHRYYNIVCNPLLWFLHHRSWGFTHTPNIDREAHTAWKQGFVAVSHMFAESIAAEAGRAGRPVVLLLRDYQMHLVGGMVRERVHGALIHYSIDVPWPDPSDWRMLPKQWRDAIFSSLLACDVLGVTSQDDVRSMLACLEEFVPGVEIDREQALVIGPEGRAARIRAHTPSVDRDSLTAAADSHRTRALAERLDARGRYTFVTAERAEPHKNIVRCVRAFSALLDRDRSLAERARYLLVLAPPPPHLSQYRRYLKEIEQAVRDVNGEHRGRSGNPVELHIENNYPMALAAMRIADTLVSVPIADAASPAPLSAPLVNERDCSLILSEAASVAEVFAGMAALVSPTDVDALATEMLRSLERPDSERKERFARLESVALGLNGESSVKDQIAELIAISKTV